MKNIKITLAFGLVALLFAIYFIVPKSSSVQEEDLSANVSQVSNGQGQAMDDHHNSPSAAPVVSKLKLKVGSSVPDFSVKDLEGNVYTKESLAGKNVVFFFNEGLMCYPACWNQIAALSKDSRFKDKNIEVLSVVVDKPADWQKATKEVADLAQARVVFDEGGKFSRELGMLESASSMHYGSLPGHSYLIMDKAGSVSYVLDDPRMAINNDLLIQEVNKLK